MDLVAMSADGTVLLVMGNEPPMTINALQDRVQAYVSFALDGQLATMNPETVGHPVKIVLALTGAPAPELSEYLTVVRPKLARYSITIDVNTGA